MQYIQVEPDVRVFVRDWGTGKPIVFIHGWPYSHEIFEYQYLPLLKHGYRCIGIDLRGYGKSDQPYEDYNFDVFADDLHLVFEALDLQAITLVGFSMGGAVAVRYMGKYLGLRVTKLALLSASTPCLTKKPDFPQGRDEAVYNDFLDKLYADRPQTLADFSKGIFCQPISSALASWFTSIAMQASPHATVKTLIALRDADLRPNLAKIEVPTAIMHGVYDSSAPIKITAEVNHKAIKDSQLIHFENSGHGIFLDEREKLNAELMRFVG
ncbi:alpha/beta fold hydrolase [Myxosarcina sp. GI1]|uniref:alpha/beta fold hydrolase n=1 Tax=Myxosarcina sp. GI1 TaxID=1541065 RepID=UPI0005643ED1|nr:alpha/beta hydrolase [Myxosarcina sp. GI1]